MNWLNLGKKIASSKQAREGMGGMIKWILIAIGALLLIAAAAVVLLFNIFICTISFGLVDGCDEGKKENFQVIKEEQFTDLGEKMKELRADTNAKVDVPGQDYGEYKSVINNMMMNEAEVHLRTLYQVDYYAMQAIDTTDEKSMEKEFGPLEDNNARFVVIWKMARQLEKETKKSASWLDTHSEEYKYVTRDWMHTILFDSYRCFFIGDENGDWYNPISWFTAQKPCEELDNLYERTFGEKKEFITHDFRGVISHIHIIIQETWACEDSGAASAFLDLLKPNVAYAHHLDQTIPRGAPPDCGEGSSAVPGPDIETSYVTYPNLIDMLYAFEQFSVFKQGETVSKEDDYKEMIHYILRELYAMFFGDTVVVPIPGMTPSAGWLIPMQEGTYYLSSPFGWRQLGGLDFHYGTDFATHRTSKVPIYATKGGTVTFANPSSGSPVGASSTNNRDVTGCGGYIGIAHDDGTSAAYCHMYREDILVQVGWKVVQGQLIAGVGNAGASTGHHLDIKVCEVTTGPFACRNGNVNPEGINVDWFDPQGAPANWVLNKDTGKVTTSNLNTAIDYFKEVSNKLKSSSDKQAEAQKHLMPGFTPPTAGIGGNFAFSMLAWKYETTFGSPGFCSSGDGDAGGVSCGIHQLSTPSQSTFVKWLQSRGTKPYSDYYEALAGLQPGSPKFVAAWKALGDRNEMEFYNIQEEYFSMAYFGPAIKKWQEWFGVDLRTEPIAIQAATYTMFIQHGAGTTIPKKLFNAQTYASTPPAEILKAFYYERSKFQNGVLLYFTSSKKANQIGVYNRLRYNEYCDALALLANPNLNLKTDSTGCSYSYTRPIGS